MKAVVLWNNKELLKFLIQFRTDDSVRRVLIKLYYSTKFSYLRRLVGKCMRGKECCSVVRKFNHSNCKPSTAYEC